MKITIVPETKNEKKDFKDVKKMQWENVYQFAITGNFMRNKQLPGRIQQEYVVLKYANQLIGDIESLKEDVRDRKRMEGIK